MSADRRTMTDSELLAWLAENGTDISQQELEVQFARVLKKLRVEDLIAESERAELDGPVLEEPSPASREQVEVSWSDSQLARLQRWRQKHH